jgi:hypothetical protein
MFWRSWVFRRVHGFTAEQRAAIKLCVKLKKTNTETFEMFKIEYREERLSKTIVFEMRKRFEEGLR